MRFILRFDIARKSCHFHGVSFSVCVLIRFQASGQAIALTVVFGFLWGFGSVTFGLATAIVGNSLGFSLILGMTSAIGAALPLVVLHPDDAGSRQGICTWIGLAIVAGGLACLAYAGLMKEREVSERVTLLESVTSNSSSTSKKSFKLGLLLCLISGIFSPMLNLSLSLGK